MGTGGFASLSEPPGPGPPPSSLTSVVVRGVGLASAGYALKQLITFGTYVVLAGLTSAADFGHFAAGTIIVGLGLVVGESGLLAALIQRRDNLEEAFNSAFLASFAGGITLSVLALATAPLIGFFFHSHKAEAVAAVMSGLMLLQLMIIVPDALLQRRFSFFRRVIVDPIGALAFAVGSITAAAAGLGVWALVIGTYATATVNVAASWALAGWRPQPRLATFRMWRELARFGRPVVGAELLRRVVGGLPVVVLGHFAGAGPLGQFTYALRVAAQPINAIISTGSYVLLPAFSRLSAHHTRFLAATLRALRWTCAVAFPAGLLLVPLGTPAVVLIFGERWRPAGHAVMALGVLCAALSLDSIASEAWKAAGRTGMLPRMHGLSAALTAVFVLTLVPFGLVGVSIGLSLSSIGVGVYAVRGLAEVVGMSIRSLVAEIWPPAVAATTMASLLFCLEHLLVHADHRGVILGLALVVAETLLGVAAYLAVLSKASPQMARELAGAVTGLIGRIRRRAQPETAAEAP